MQKTTSEVTFLKSSHLDVIFKNVPLKYLANFIGKHLYKSLFIKAVSGCRSATLFQKRLKYRAFFGEMSKTFQNCFFIVHLRTTVSDLIEYLETLTIN